MGIGTRRLGLVGMTIPVQNGCVFGVFKSFRAPDFGRFLDGGSVIYNELVVSTVDSEFEYMQDRSIQYQTES